MGNSKKKLRDSVFEKEFREDLYYWVKHDRKIGLKIFDLAEAIMKDPFKGAGKPEPLKFPGSNIWSRRLTQEHRIVYVVHDDRITFVQCRYHY